MNYLPVRTLARALHASGNPWKALLMVDCGSYFDDSGTHKGSVVTVIGGYIGTMDAWDAIEGPWRAVMDPYKSRGIDAFHASHCLNQWKKYKDVPSDECTRIYDRLSGLLESATGLQPIYTAVWTSDWEKIQGRKFNMVHRSAYDFCVDRAIHEVVNWSANNAGGTPVPVVMAAQQEHDEESESTYASWKRVTVIEEKLGSFTVASPSKLIQLQAADMLAYEAYRHLTWLDAMEHGKDTASERVYRRCLDKIMSGRRQAGGDFDEWFLQVVAGEIDALNPEEAIKLSSSEARSA